MKRKSSLVLSFSDDTVDDSKDADDLPESYEAIKDPDDAENEEDILGKTPILSNTHMAACGGSAVELFSQRKAMSLRAGWI